MRKFLKNALFLYFVLDPLTSHILDAASGIPAANVEATLLRWIPGTWEVIETK